jgi:[acyl-carrier-protein] S-malonyltransferase
VFEGPDEQLKLTETQPAILAVSTAARVLSEAGAALTSWLAIVLAIMPRSCRELVEAGDALRIVRKRGTYMQESVPVGQGAMAAILGMTRISGSSVSRSAQSEVLSGQSRSLHRLSLQERQLR